MSRNKSLKSVVVGLLAALTIPFAVGIYLSGVVYGVAGFLGEDSHWPANLGRGHVEAPAPLLQQTREQTGASQARETFPPLTARGAPQVAGSGPQVHGSPAWNAAGFSGQGIKMGIIDGGFEGFSGLMGSELPGTAKVTARCYTDFGAFTNDLADCEVDGDHGTRVAEAIADIAPEVSLYIASPSEWADLSDTVDWMISEGVQVINQSIGWAYDGPGDGTSSHGAGPLQTVDRAVDGGIVWVNAAGNDARTTWFGDYSDADGDGYIEFDGANFANGMSHEAGDLVTVQLRWDDTWGAAGRDLDLYLVDVETNRILLRGTDGQFGQPGHDPYEFFKYRVNKGGRVYIAVEHFSGSAPEWVQVVVSGDVDSIEHTTEGYSIANPAESANPGLLAVGAAPWDDVQRVWPDSSLGPSIVGDRVKPDLVGANCGESALPPPKEDGDDSCGTSQAAAHVAGLAALVRQRYPQWGPVQVANYLRETAEPREAPDPNNTWGHGFARLPALDAPPPPTPTPTPPTDACLSDLGTLDRGDAKHRVGTWADDCPSNSRDGSYARFYTFTLDQRMPVQIDLTSSKDPYLFLLRGSGRNGGVVDENDDVVSGTDTNSQISTTLDAGTYTIEATTYRGGTTGEFGLTVLVPPEPTPPPSAGNCLTDLGAFPRGRLERVSGNWAAGCESTNRDGRYARFYTFTLEQETEVQIDLTSSQDPYLFLLQGAGTDGTVVDKNDDIDFGGGNYNSRIYQTLPAGDYTIEATTFSEGATGDFMLTITPGGAADRGALVALYNATNGDNWENKDNWLSDAPLGEWYGVDTDSNSQVTDLVLDENQLSGEIPAELGNLSNLEYLYLGGNQLSGEIPAELGNLSNLEYLYLGGNQLSGEIPGELAGLYKLDALLLDDNELTGPIPSWLGGLANLVKVNLSGNQLTGEIPMELGRLTNLETLDISDNQLTGTIPPQLSDLADLTWLTLSQNQLTGQIPPELGHLSNVRDLRFSDNRLTGEIPPELGNLDLWELDFSDNRLTGEIPPELGNLANLGVLRLSGNQLTGTIPPELGNLEYLFLLYLAGNQLTGCIPQSLQDVSDNDFDELGLPFCAV